MRLCMLALPARGSALLGAAVLAPGTASAQLASCAELLSHPPLAGNPAVFSATSVQATTGGRDYCNVQVVWRDPALYSTDFNVNLNLYADQESIDLAAAAGVDVSQAITYEDVAQLVSERTADFVDADFVERLREAYNRGVKIIVTHGTADSLIQWRNAADMYTRAAAYFGNGTPDYGALHSWYRFFAVPGLGHAGVNVLSQVIDWVENGVVPERIVRTTGFRVACPFPQEAIHLGGSATDPNNFVCGGNLQTKAAICTDLRTPYKEETSDKLQAYGRHNPAACNESSNVPLGPGPAAVVSEEFRGYDVDDETSAEGDPVDAG